MKNHSAYLQITFLVNLEIPPMPTVTSDSTLGAGARIKIIRQAG